MLAVGTDAQKIYGRSRGCLFLIFMQFSKIMSKNGLVSSPKVGTPWEILDPPLYLQLLNMSNNLLISQFHLNCFIVAGN